MGRMTEPRPIATWLTDMDGVLVHEEDPIPGAKEFVEALKGTGLPFLVLTNNSIFTPRDLRARLLMSASTCPRTRSGPLRSRLLSSCSTSAPGVRRTSWGRRA
jgi:NagD protein